MREIPTTVVLCSGLLMLSLACDSFFGEPNNQDAEDTASSGKGLGGVHIHNCTVVNRSGEPASGRAYHIFARLNNGEWIDKGEIASNLTKPAECSDGTTLDVDFQKQTGNWEILAIQVAKPGEFPACFSNVPVGKLCGNSVQGFSGGTSANWGEMHLTQN